MGLTQFEIHYTGSHSAYNGKCFGVTAIDAAEAVELLRAWLNENGQTLPEDIQQETTTTNPHEPKKLNL